jgi:hypothetical protein
MNSFMMALYSKEEEQKVLLRNAQMRLEKVEELLKPIKSKHFMSEDDNNMPLHGPNKSNINETQLADYDSSSFASQAKSRAAGQIYDPECVTNSDDEGDFSKVDLEAMTLLVGTGQSHSVGTEGKKNAADPKASTRIWSNSGKTFIKQTCCF